MILVDEENWEKSMSSIFKLGLDMRMKAIIVSLDSIKIRKEAVSLRKETC